MDKQSDELELKAEKPTKSEELKGKYAIRVQVGGHPIGVRVTSEEESFCREAAEYANTYFNAYVGKDSRVNLCLSYSLLSVAEELMRAKAELESLKQQIKELNDAISQTLSIK